MIQANTRWLPSITPATRPATATPKWNVSSLTPNPVFTAAFGEENAFPYRMQQARMLRWWTCAERHEFFEMLGHLGCVDSSRIWRFRFQSGFRCRVDTPPYFRVLLPAEPWVEAFSFAAYKYPPMTLINLMKRFEPSHGVLTKPLSRAHYTHVIIIDTDRHHLNILMRCSNQRCETKPRQWKMDEQGSCTYSCGICWPLRIFVSTQGSSFWNIKDPRLETSRILTQGSSFANIEDPHSRILAHKGWYFEDPCSQRVILWGSLLTGEILRGSNIEDPRQQMVIIWGSMSKAIL